MTTPSSLLSATRAITAITAILGLVSTARSAMVTFQVNMAAQVALGSFNPASDSVFVAGDPLNAWSPTESQLELVPGTPNIFGGTFELAGTAGSEGQYKFLMVTASGTIWEGNVGSGGAAGNRTFTLADTDQTLPVVYFNNVSSGTSVTSDVTFVVNLSVQSVLGSFDPESGTINVAGEFNAWSTSASSLSRDLAQPDLWKVTLPLTGADGSTVQYKFVMNGGTWEGNVGPNGAQNRALTLASGAQALPVAYFNNLTALPGQIPVTFQVDLATLIARGTFDPDSGTVSVAGDVLNQWDPSASMLTRSAPGSYLWTGTFELAGAPGLVLQFKYVLNGGSWETIDNRAYTLASADPQTLPPVYFDNLNNLGSVTHGPRSGDQVTLSWTAGALIRLQSTPDVSRGPWQDVPNTLGQSTASVSVGSGAAYFRLMGP